MANLTVPPPTRIPLASVTVGGKKVDIFMNEEWARYFNSLNNQVVVVSSATGLPGAPGQTGAAGSAVSLQGDGGGDSVEFIPMPGPKGDKGDAGIPLDLLENESPAVEFIPGPRGEQGAQGPAGPAVFILQEPENNDVFWPIQNT